MSNNHYVPRLILRKFGDKLCLYNAKTGELKENIPPERACAMQDFYDNETEKKMHSLGHYNEKIKGGLPASFLFLQGKSAKIDKTRCIFDKTVL